MTHESGFSAGAWVTAVGVGLALLVALQNWSQQLRAARREHARFVYATALWTPKPPEGPGGEQTSAITVTVYNQAPMVASNVLVEVTDSHPPYTDMPTDQRTRGPWLIALDRPQVVPPNDHRVAVYAIPPALRLPDVTRLWFEDGNGRTWCRDRNRGLRLVRRFEWQWWRGAARP